MRPARVVRANNSNTATLRPLAFYAGEGVSARGRPRCPTPSRACPRGPTSASVGQARIRVNLPLSPANTRTCHGASPSSAAPMPTHPPNLEATETQDYALPSTNDGFAPRASENISSKGSKLYTPQLTHCARRTPGGRPAICPTSAVREKRRPHADDIYIADEASTPARRRVKPIPSSTARDRHGRASPSPRDPTASSTT